MSPCVTISRRSWLRELARHFLPDRLAEEVAEADPPIVHRIGEEDAPAILGQLDVLEVRPALGIDADRGADVDLVVVLEALRPHVRATTGCSSAASARARAAGACCRTG